MEKDSDDKRKIKEFVFSLHKKIIHVFTIGALILLYRSLFVTLDDNHWVYVGCLGYLILKLVATSIRENKARDLGIAVTEYIEKRDKEKGKD